MRTNSSRDIQHNKETKNSRRSRNNTSRDFLSFVDSTEQSIPRPIDKDKRKTDHSGKNEKTYYSKDPVYG